MALSQRDKVGLGIIIALLLALMGALVLTMSPPQGGAGSPEESVFVQQRIRNLQK